MNVSEIIFIKIKLGERKIRQSGLRGLGMGRRGLESVALLLTKTRQQIALYSLRIQHP